MGLLEDLVTETAVKAALKNGNSGQKKSLKTLIKEEFGEEFDPKDIQPEYRKIFSDEELHKLDSYFWGYGDLFGYLCKTDKKFLIVFILGVLGIFLFGLGLIALVYAGILFYKEWKKLPTDEEFDALKQKAFKTLDTISLEKLGLDKSDTVRDNEVISGPKYTSGIYKIGKDGYIRYRSYWVLVSNFTKKQLATYKCSLDLITGRRYSESTDEYFYKDIVSVGTRENEDGWTTFELRNSGAGSIEVPLFSNSFSKEIKGKFEPTDADKVINSIRVVIRGNK